MNFKQMIQTPVTTLSKVDLESLVKHLNEQYRLGTPLVSDTDYDRIFLQELKNRFSTSNFLFAPEPTVSVSGLSAKGMMLHDKPMLSTNKANSLADIEAYIERCVLAGQRININKSDILFRLSEKLDGVAGRIRSTGDNSGLFTRGDGKHGTIVTSLIDKGLVVNGQITDIDSFGEIIISKAYFDTYLSKDYANSRNCVSGIVNADTHKNGALKALNDGAVELVLYSGLTGITCNAEELVRDLVEIGIDMRDSNKYLTDGVVIEVISPLLREAMGSNNVFNNYQIAFKLPDQEVPVQVIDIAWQVSRTGKLNPVIKCSPVFLGGVSISSITGVHLSNLIDENISIGATINIARANSVIPDYRSLVATGEKLQYPQTCPCCGFKTEHEGLYLVCNNSESCSAQSVRKVIHHMRLVGADLFGEKTLEKLADSGHVSVVDIYNMTLTDCTDAGLGDKQAANLLQEIERVKAHPLDDFKLLASMGISKLGRGSSEKLLSVYNISEIHTITAEKLNELDGFGGITSKSVTEALHARQDELQFLLGFYSNNLIHSSDKSSIEGSLTGVNVCFTGKMNQGSRSDMKRHAESMGATVQSSITKSTTLLVTGDNVGKSKLDKAMKAGIKIISESEYYEL